MTIFNKWIYSAVFFFLTFPSYALEVDNYYAWGKPLQDSLFIANQKMNEILTEVENENKKPNCENIAENVYKKLLEIREKTNANWDPFRDSMQPPKNEDLDHYYKIESIYREIAHSFKGRFTHLAGTIEMNGIQMGVDKIAHFGLIGYKYFEVYQKSLKKELQKKTPLPHAIQKAKTDAFEYGIKTEKSSLGLWLITFSYADLEANFQGLLFYNQLTDGTNPYFILNEKMECVRSKRIFHWMDYISAYLDETYNASGYRESKWEKVKPFLLDYCPQLGSREVQNRFDFYKRSFQKSESQLYMEEQAFLKRTPEQKYLANLCSQN